MAQRVRGVKVTRRYFGRNPAMYSPGSAWIDACCALAAGIALALPAPVWALKFDLGSQVHGSFDSNLSYGLLLRTQSRSCGLVALDNGGCVATTAELPEASQDAYSINADDGDLNYNKGHIVSQVFKGTHELALKGPDDWSFFGRFSALYDVSIDNTERTPLTSDAHSVAVHNFQPLDLYLNKQFDLLGRNGRVRVGKSGRQLGREHLCAWRHQ